MLGRRNHGSWTASGRPRPTRLRAQLGPVAMNGRFCFQTDAEAWHRLPVLETAAHPKGRLRAGSPLAGSPARGSGGCGAQERLRWPCSDIRSAVPGLHVSGAHPRLWRQQVLDDSGDARSGPGAHRGFLGFVIEATGRGRRAGSRSGCAAAASPPPPCALALPRPRLWRPCDAVPSPGTPLCERSQAACGTQGRRLARPSVHRASSCPRRRWPAGGELSPGSWTRPVSATGHPAGTETAAREDQWPPPRAVALWPRRWDELELGLRPCSDAGREQFHGLGSMYCRGAAAVILTYDVNQLQSLRELEDRFLGLTDTASANCLFAIVGNKVDLSEGAPAGRERAGRGPGSGHGGASPKVARQVQPEDALALYRKVLKHRMLDEKDAPAAEQMCFETSAKTGRGVDLLFETLLELVALVIRQRREDQPPQTVELGDHKPPGRAPSGCCA
ncbi:Ras-related protein Rab-20 [Galemys pyrenaicus]|uniref:Ras-related protein Rab-20 n=1 Tax=Galemys pyrenaicus TaxID=202257 RepID=A0A8J6A8K8_GALPY|nr:Ras-related protein Rab-20 [Galemys pyrenaicus]